MASAVAQIGPASKSSKVTRQQQSQCRGFWKIGLPCAARSLPQYWYSCWAHLPPDGYREVWRGDPGIMKPSPIGKTLTLILRLHIRWQPLLGASKVGPLKHQRVEQRSSQGRAKPARQWRARSGRGHKYEKKLLSTYGKLCKPSIAPTKQGHCNILPVVPPLPLRKFLHLSDPCVWSPARPFRTRLPF